MRIFLFLKFLKQSCVAGKPALHNVIKSPRTRVERQADDVGSIICHFHTKLKWKNWKFRDPNQFGLLGTFLSPDFSWESSRIFSRLAHAWSESNSHSSSASGSRVILWACSQATLRHALSATLMDFHALSSNFYLNLRQIFLDKRREFSFWICSKFFLRIVQNFLSFGPRWWELKKTLMRANSQLLSFSLIECFSWRSKRHDHEMKAVYRKFTSRHHQWKNTDIFATQFRYTLESKVENINSPFCFVYISVFYV